MGLLAIWPWIWTHYKFMPCATPNFFFFFFEGSCYRLFFWVTTGLMAGSCSLATSLMLYNMYNIGSDDVDYELTFDLIFPLAFFLCSFLLVLTFVTF